MAVSTTAQNKKDVDSMNVRDRLYDSLSYTYGKRGEDIEKQYNKLTSQTNNSLLSRGMQRSSYGAQTAANIGKQMVDALGQNASDLIADYENRLYQVERDEKADQKWEAEFGETQKQNEWNRNFQQTQADRSQANWEKEFAETLAMNKFNRDYAQDEFKYKYGLAGSGAGESAGGGGNGGNGGAVVNPGTKPSAQNVDQALAAADVATAFVNKANQIKNAAQTNAAKQAQIDQYQRQINALTQRLGTVKTVSERNEITSQIGALNQKIKNLK